MKNAVKFWGNNPDAPAGIPATWPCEVLILNDTDTTPDGYTEMTEAAYAQYIVDNQASYDAWVDPQTLATERATAWAEVQLLRSRYQNGGVHISSIDKWFHSDSQSRIQQLGLVMMGANMPAGIQWKTMDGSFIIMTPTVAGQIFNAVATLDMTAFAVAEQHRGAIMASSTPSTYNFSVGWPTVYFLPVIQSA